MWAALGTNERFSAGAATTVRLQSLNTAYTQRVKWMKEQDKWRDQYGKPVTDITPEESIGLRVQEVDTKTKQTPISYQQARIITVCRNELAPLLDKIVDKDGKIPSGRQVSDIQEELRVAYFNSLTSYNLPEPVSSEDQATKAKRLDILATARTNKLLKFHPMELYIYFQFGPASVGGSASPYFLESAAAIQKAVKAGECSNREELRKRNNKELLDKAHTKKAMKLKKLRQFSERTSAGPPLQKSNPGTCLDYRRKCAVQTITRAGILGLRSRLARSGPGGPAQPLQVSRLHRHAPCLTCATSPRPTPAVQAEYGGPVCSDRSCPEPCLQGAVCGWAPAQDGTWSA
jgi:hypothetical protein